MRNILILLSLLIISSCTSQPTRTVPDIIVNEIPESFGTVTIVGCEEDKGETLYKMDCEAKSYELAENLKSLGIFSSVEIGADNPSDYSIKINSYERDYYYTSIGHNPGILLLSLVIPFWQSTSYGYDFEIFSSNTVDPVRINTYFEGTDILWSGSVFINMSSARGIPGTHYSTEQSYLKNTIINALSTKALNQQLHRTP